MGKEIFSTIILALLTETVCVAQEAVTDFKETSFGLADSVPASLIHPDLLYISSLSVRDFQNIPYSFDTSALVIPDSTSREYSTYRDEYSTVPGTAIFPMWKTSAFVAAGNCSLYPGLMEIHSGLAGFVHNLRNVSFYIGAEANKYGYFNGLHTQYGLNGTIQYSVTPALTLTGYATYYFGGQPLMSLSMIAYYGVSAFGGTAEYQFNEAFGLIVGGEAKQQVGTNKYRFEPIVTPTLKIGKVRLGLPVGQIVNGMIRSKIESRRRNGKNLSYLSATRKKTEVTLANLDLLRHCRQNRYGKQFNDTQRKVAR